ncbi:MAG TPA: HupE/UreJ family protein [Gammaproteobacteria bacterium]
MRRAGRRLVPRLAALGLVLAPALTVAHDARPLSITLIEQAVDVFRVVVRIPPTVEAANLPQITWPDTCERLDGADSVRALTSTGLIQCPGGLATRPIRIDYPYYNPSITTLIRLQTRDGFLLSAVLPPDELEWTAPAEPTLVSVAIDYLKLGIRHIWAGIDHLLFVAGLLLLARRPGKIFWAITGFTVAHSITLSLAALDLIRVAVAPVEAMIALSILFLASEIARNDATTFSRRFPVVLSFVFGLLHGFGFASALGEIGLPRTELAAGLLFFNLGVELGQLGFITLVVAIVLTVRTLVPHLRRLQAPTLARANLAGAYCLGIPAAFWFAQRTATAFGL